MGKLFCHVSYTSIKLFFKKQMILFKKENLQTMS